LRKKNLLAKRIFIIQVTIELILGERFSDSISKYF